MTLLSQGIPTAGDDEESLLGPALYLLDKVLPKVPQPILRLKAPDVSAVLGSLLSNQSLETSAMRSALGSAETLLRVCSVEGRAETALYTSMYRAALSPKPKIRRRGSEAIVHLLGLQEVESSDETNNKATMDRLAISQRTLDLALQTLPADGSVTQGLEPVSEWIHLLTLLRSVMPELLGTLLLPLLRFGTQRLQSPLKCSVTKANESALRLCQSLLGLPQRAPGAPLVAQLTYGVLDGIVSAIEEDMSGKGDSEEGILMLTAYYHGSQNN